MSGPQSWSVGTTGLEAPAFSILEKFKLAPIALVNAESDARLIAAAPTLYAELEKCVDHSCTCGECNRLRGVLARARGETA